MLGSTYTLWVGLVDLPYSMNGGDHRRVVGIEGGAQTLR